MLPLTAPLEMKDKKIMNGVVAYIVEKDTGRTTHTMDDVSSNRQLPTIWSQEIFYTSYSYDSETMKNLKLTKEQYAEIGESIILRLLAVNGMLKL